MAVKQWTLIDTEQNVAEDSLTIDKARGTIEHPEVRIQINRLRGGLSEGVHELTVQTGELRYVALPTRGMSLWKVFRGDHEFGWKSPVPGPVHPQYVPLHDPNGLGWLEGFDEFLVRCGCESNGAPAFDEQGQLQFPLHGRVGNKPAHRVTVEVDEATGEVTVRGVIDEVRFHFAKFRLETTYRTKPGSSQLEIADKVTNLSSSPATMQMLYHVNLGVPLLDAGTRFVAPVKDVKPRDERAAEGLEQWQHYGPPEPGFAEQVYLATLHADQSQRTVALLKNAHGMQATAIHHRVDQLPCFTVWKNTTAVDDGYVTGIEPGTNFPYPKPEEEEAGRVVKLEPKASQAFDLAIDFLTSDREVAQVESEIDRIARQASSD